MGLFDALTSAVSGLQAQSFAMQNISGNIANSQTIAYKGINTSFSDLIPSASVPTKQVSGGVLANSMATMCRGRSRPHHPARTW
jgi:flagellar hook protein FlgE